jgi:hypothetical protein
MKKTYKGSCHCGAVRYEADLDLGEGTVKCNCSICVKDRKWLAAVKPEAFRFLSGEADLSDYQFGTRRIHHLFCKHCGVRSFTWGDASRGGRFYAIHLGSLDDADAEELANARVMYVDGRNDDFKTPPKETRHL